MIGKFMYHLPFYRQIQQYKEAGITISDSTMGDWYEAAVERLKLLYDILRKQILQSEYIHVDESTVPVIDNEKHKTRKGYEWCVLDGLSGDVMFYYDRGSRAANAGLICAASLSRLWIRTKDTPPRQSSISANCTRWSRRRTRRNSLRNSARKNASRSHIR